MRVVYLRGRCRLRLCDVVVLSFSYRQLFSRTAGTASTTFSFYLACRRGWIERIPERAPLREQAVACGRAVAKFALSPSRAWLSVALSLGGLMVYFGVFLCSGHAFSLDLGWLDLYAVLPVVDSFAALPVSVSGLGVREKLFEILLERLAGVPQAEAVLMSLGGFAAMSVWSLLGVLGLPGYRTSAGREITLKEVVGQA